MVDTARTKRATRRSFDWPTCFASYEQVKAIVDNKMAMCFVWPDEGQFDGDKFVFNKEHCEPLQYEPLLVDMVTANLIVACHDAFRNEDNQKKFREWIASHRGRFAALVNLGWKVAK